MGKYRFDEINQIVIDVENKRVVRSNHPQYKPGARIDEKLMFNKLGRGWCVVRKRNDRPLVENIAVSDLIHDIILAREDDGKWTVFSKGTGDKEILVFAQQRGSKVYAQDSAGEEKYFDSVNDFLKTLSGFVLAGIVSDEEMEDEMEEE